MVKDAVKLLHTEISAGQELFFKEKKKGDKKGELKGKRGSETNRNAAGIFNARKSVG